MVNINKGNSSIKAKNLALAIAGAASEKKALDIVIMKMKKVSSVCDYFVIASGTSTTHVRALSDNIVSVMESKGRPLRHIEGEREASWILLDFVDVVCHLFLDQTRSYYKLEKLWEKAPRERFEDPKPKKKAVKKQAKKGVSEKKAATKKKKSRSRR